MSDETTPENEQVVDLASFASVEQFDAHIEQLGAEPTVANMIAQAEAVAAKSDYMAAQAALADATAAIEAAAASDETVEVEIVDETVEVEVSETVEPAAEVVEANPELIAAAVAAPAVVTVADQKPTGEAATSRRTAQVRHVLGHSKQEVTGVRDMEAKFRAALRNSHTTESTVFEFPVFDRNQVGEDNILKANNTAAQNDRILGITDAEGNRLDGVRDFRTASIHKAGMAAKMHRANCGGCDDCGNILDTPDCFAEYGEALGDCFDAIPADTCAWSVRKQETLADLDQQVFMYCGEDAEGNPASGILQEDGTVVPIDATDPTTWKNHYEIKTTCGDKVKYSLEEFPMLFTIDRDVDKCSEDGAVTRTLNRYFSLQSRFMEARKKAILEGWAADNGYGGVLAAPSGIGLGHDLGTLLNTVAGVIQAQAGVDALEGFKLAVPDGMPAWAECAAPGTIQALADKTGLAGLVECGGTGPYSDAKTYQVGVDAEGVAAPKIPVDALAEALKTWNFVAFDASQWRKPVGETVRIGMTDTFRDFDLAKQNKRGIVIYRDETLIPVGCVPSVCFEATLCNIPVDPARSAIAACG